VRARQPKVEGGRILTPNFHIIFNDESVNVFISIEADLSGRADTGPSCFIAALFLDFGGCLPEKILSLSARRFPQWYE
jgi:hypothetical protein